MLKRAARIPMFTGMILAAFLFLPVFLTGSLQAAEKDKNLSDDFPVMIESKAYQQFKTRPVSDLSKLIYLIDRFGTSKVEIVYDGHYYKAAFGAQLAKFFLAQNYRKETAEQWIMKWCNVSVGGNLIWVKFPDNRFKLARDVLKREITDLEDLIKAEDAKKFAAPDLSEVTAIPDAHAAAEVLEKTANAATAIETQAGNSIRKATADAVALATS